jgi:hypothetical protein
VREIRRVDIIKREFIAKKHSVAMQQPQPKDTDEEIMRDAQARVAQLEADIRRRKQIAPVIRRKDVVLASNRPAVVREM